ncbi:helix-turn-helix domain-containing protein [Peribacillus loiseleuriae]|uniref:Transcriptional regulator n=1 Tax=Peribacillus loiseleuriae TaxID=1679170 RepID=A0A0K9GWN6_9BACI|nr:helix-turn-helix transcriptional regulator [Peribacillus loiseleuriae]KMY51055.1 transcriptional regulator [Peribacillus loiseleuriae]
MIGNRVKKVREENKMSISQLAERANIAKSYISSLERNLQTNPTIWVLEKIATVLSVTVDSLLDEQVNNKTLDAEWLEIMQDAIILGISKEEMEINESLIY